MDVSLFAASLLASLFNPACWVVAGGLGWFVPNRWWAALAALPLTFVIVAVLHPHIHGEMGWAQVIVSAALTFGVGTWRDRWRLRQERLAPPMLPLDPLRIEPKPMAVNRDHVFTAIKMIGPVKRAVRSGFHFLENAPLGIYTDVDFDDVTEEVIGHLLAFHAALVREQPSTLPLAVFALGQAVDRGFNTDHERIEQDVCAQALGNLARQALDRAWPPGDQQLLEAAFHAFMRWDKQPRRHNLVLDGKPWPE